MTNNRRSRSLRPLVTWPVMVVLGAGCGLAQRPSLKVVDPQLKAEGVALERQRRPGGFALGRYGVREQGMRAEPPDRDGPLWSPDVARPVTQHRAGLVLDGAEGRAWTTVCHLQRRASVATEFRAVLDENGDEVAVDCTAKASGQRPWRFTARALLSANFVGALGPEGDEGHPVEVLTRVVRFSRIQRILPVPVAQLRHGEDAVVAVLLGRPERAWVARSLDPVGAEAALSLLLTLRLLPWELAE